MTPLDTVIELRPSYPTPMSDRQRGELLNAVAWRHRADGWGLLKKPSGAHVLQPQTGTPVSGDILCRIEAPNLVLFDLLKDGEGAGTPTWGKKKPLQDLSRWVAPLDPKAFIFDVNGDALPPPVLPPPPPIVSLPPWNEAQAVQFGEACNAVYRESGAAVDLGMVAVHAGRVQYSFYVTGMPWDKAFKKHVAEFRAEYGLR